MSFTTTEVEAFVHGLPQGAFGSAGAEASVKWCEFLLTVDEAPKAHHDLFWFLSVGRLLAEKMGSLSPIDFGEAHMREMIGNIIKPGEKPYEAETESAEFRAWSVSPAQVAFAYRVQRKCAATVPKEPTPESTLAGTMSAYLEAQAASHKRSAKALSFKLADRLTELGMDQFPEDALPSEETLAVFEAAGRVAKEKGRLFVGSADGEDLQKNFRPAWSKIPRIDVPVGDGSVPERQRQMAELKRLRATSELDYPGYSTFHAHIMDWGVKLVLMKTATPLEVLGYSILLTKVAEEEGGVRTAYQYDVLARTAMAKALERGDSAWKVYLQKLDRDLVGQAKSKVRDRAAENAKAAEAKGASKGKHGKGEGPGPKGGAERSAGSSARQARTPPRSRSPYHQGGRYQGGDQGSWKQKGWQQQQRKW